jgi:hypothetical protein
MRWDDAPREHEAGMRQTQGNTALTGVQRQTAKGETHWMENALVTAI